MNTLNYIGVTEENRSSFHSLMLSYAKELDEHQHRNTDPVVLKKWTDSIIAKQHEPSRCLKLCYDGAKLIGFLYGKIDQTEDKGCKRSGQGCIMEFYVQPKHRRKGCGKEMFRHIESFFKAENVKQMYLTADPVTGKPFWEALGFVSKGEFSPDNGQEIYEKALSPKVVANLYVQKADIKDAENIAMLYNKNIAPLHGTVISSNEWREALAEKDEDEVHFLIYKDTIPVAWLKINGLSERDSAWISMLAVAPNFQRQGTGKYAVRYAEEYCKSYGKKKLLVKTTADNTAAQKLYQKCEFIVCDKTAYTTSDGISRNGIIFSKTIN